jgi:tetratricopeptide (TPR) repeat protein
MSDIANFARLIRRRATPWLLPAGLLALASWSALGQGAALTQCTSAKSADARIEACSAAIAAERGRAVAIAYNFRAVAWQDKYDLDRALADYSEAVRLDSGYANAFNNRGIAWQAKGDLDRAIADHSEAIRLDPKDNSGAHRFRSIALRLKGEVDRAIADAGEAIRLYPDYNAAYVARGLAYEDKHDVERARADYNQALAMPAHYPSGPQAQSDGRDRLAALDRAAALQKADGAGSQTFSRKVALVIGNSQYRFSNQLANPANDAADIAAALRRLGFEVVEGKDLDRRGMEDAIRQFGRKLERADLALFFYAGHGLQVNNKNYLVPVDARLERSGDLALDALDMDIVLAQMEAEKRVNLIFLDACRDNPFAGNLSRSLAARSGSVGRGLARVQSAIGTLIAYATQPDNVALDGDGRNSPFTAALLRHIASPGLDIGLILRRVRAEVIAITRERQVPWDHSSIVGEVVLAR